MAVFVCIVLVFRGFSGRCCILVCLLLFLSVSFVFSSFSGTPGSSCVWGVAGVSAWSRWVGGWLSLVFGVGCFSVFVVYLFVCWSMGAQACLVVSFVSGFTYDRLGLLRFCLILACFVVLCRLFVFRCWFRTQLFYSLFSRWGVYLRLGCVLVGR